MGVPGPWSREIMAHRPLRFLLIEDQQNDAELFRRLCRQTGLQIGELRHVDSVAQSLQYLTERQFDLVFLDLSLPDSNPATTLQHILEHALDMPIIVLTGFENEDLALDALRGGAQDYLVKGQTNPGTFRRAVLYAIERQGVVLELRQKALTDSLTGLHNRHGFLTLARHQLKVALRTRTPAKLIYVDLDGLKQINDGFGHKAGDEALRQLAVVLRQTCRESDLVARLGGDEFAILTVSSRAEGEEPLSGRLNLALRSHNVGLGQPWQLSISIGLSYFDPTNPMPLDHLLMEADHAMYGAKQRRGSAWAPARGATADNRTGALSTDIDPGRSATERFWGEIAPVEHAVQIHANDSVLADSLEGFAGSGLRAGDSVIIIATLSHRATLEQRLRARGHKLDLAVREDRYIALDAETALPQIMLNGRPDQERFQQFVTPLITRARGQGRRMRVFGEIVALLWDLGQSEAAIRLEDLWNQSRVEQEAFLLFCAYPLSGFSQNASASIQEICSHHSRVLPEQ
jgi:two-component system, cell cycle response regulator